MSVSLRHYYLNCGTLNFFKLLLGNIFHVSWDAVTFITYRACSLARLDPIRRRGPLFARPDSQYRKTGLPGQWNETITRQLRWFRLRYSIALLEPLDRTLAAGESVASVSGRTRMFIVHI